MITRFAPSPTGLLHRGHAFSALTAVAAAREAGGRFILRIEDIDAGRCREPFVEAINEDLAWLGLEWEQPVRRQSEHLDDYTAALERLAAQGLLYRCFKTRREVLEDIGRAPHAAPEAYFGVSLDPAEERRRLDLGAPYAWRLSLRAAREALGPQWNELDFVEEGRGPDGETGRLWARPERAGDVILARKGLGVAYHLAVTVDDALQGITHVIRGSDLFLAVDVQRLLQALLGLPTPVYRHHRLLTGADGKRFAKRDRAETLRDLRQAGVSAKTLRGELGLD